MSSIVVGDDTGLIKVVRVADGTIVQKFGEQGMGKGITNMCWAVPDIQHHDNRLVCTNAVGSIVQYDTHTGQLITQRAGSEKIIGLSSIATKQISLSTTTKIDNSSDASQLTYDTTMIVTCTNTGNLTLSPLSILCDNSPISSSKTTSTPSSSTTTNNIHTIKIGDNISRMCHSSYPNSTLIAAGGKENLLRIYDLQNLSCVFRAKNVPHDHLNLRQPVHLTDVAFFNTNEQQIVEGTAYHHIRIYDIRVKKQPVIDVDIGEYRITSITVCPDDRLLIAGDGAGALHQLDTRTLRILGSYHGIGGSVRCARVDSSSIHVASVGLDRYLRIYDCKKRTLSKKVYLKQQLNVCLWNELEVEDGKIKKEQDTENIKTEAINGEDGSDDEDIDDDSIWNELNQRTATQLASKPEQKEKMTNKKRKIKAEESDGASTPIPATPLSSIDTSMASISTEEAEDRDSLDHSNNLPNNNINSSIGDNNVRVVSSIMPASTVRASSSKKSRFVIGRIPNRLSRHREEH